MLAEVPGAVVEVENMLVERRFPEAIWPYNNYAHLIAPTPLHEGEQVKTGVELGRIGQTGNAAGTPCHLHFELRHHGTPVDPEPHLRDWDAYS